MKAQSKTYLLILGSPFSGSTMLGNALNQSADVSFLGEVNSCAHAFLDYKEDDAVFQQRRRDRCHISSELGESCSFWTDALSEELQGMGPRQALEHLVEAAPGRIVLDDSKYSDWLVYLLRRVGLKKIVAEFRIIVLSRHPLAFAESFVNAERVGLGRALEFYSASYRSIFESVKGLEFDILRFEEFQEEPVEFTRRILKGVGTACPDFDRRLQPAAENHSLGGNQSAYFLYPSIAKKLRERSPLEDAQREAVYRGKMLRYAEGIRTFEPDYERWSEVFGDDYAEVVARNGELLALSRKMGRDFSIGDGQI